MSSDLGFRISNLQENCLRPFSLLKSEIPYPKSEIVLPCTRLRLAAKRRRDLMGDAANKRLLETAAARREIRD
jgi:hypothetical protein